MKQFRSIRQVAHAPADMFDLVADVENYPKFVPLCSSLTVRDRRDDGERTHITAIMRVEYAMFRERYTSRIVADRSALSIDVDQLTGPFKTLTNHWRFRPAGAGTEVEFRLAYEFKSRLMQMAAGAVLDKAFSRFAEAFERRADVVYGRAARSSNIKSA